MSVGFVLVCAGLSRVRKVTKGLTAICERGVGVYAGRISTSIGVNCEAGHINRDMGWPRTGETAAIWQSKLFPGTLMLCLSHYHKPGPRIEVTTILPID